MEKKIIRSAIPIYLAALVWVICGMLLPMYRISFILVCAGISVAVYLLASRFFPGREIEVEKAPDSGDAEVNRQITEGRAGLNQLKEHASAINDPGVNAALTRMINAGDKIFLALEKQPQQSQQVRKFMNYYLPTSVKLLDSWRTLSSAGATQNIQSSMQSIESSMGMVADAFEKQLDRLYADDQLDINAEISALETMMAADGLKNNLDLRQQSTRN